MSIDAAIQEMLADLRALPELKQVPGYPPAGIHEYPFLIGFCDSGLCALNSHSKTVHCRYTVALQLHVSAPVLSPAVERAMALEQPMAHAIFAGAARDRFNETILQLHQVTLAFRDLRWGSDQNLGWEIRVDVTTQWAVDLAA